MKKFGDFVRRNGSKHEPTAVSAPPSSSGGSLESSMKDTILAFTESGNPNRQRGANDKDEAVYLTEIVDLAEASPGAARKAVYTIKEVLDKKSKSKPYARYNAIMLIEILGKNPGKSFTDNLGDKEFVETAKYVLQYERDVSVAESLRRSLEWLESTGGNDEKLKPLLEMWKGEKGKMQASRMSGYPNQAFGGYNQYGPPRPQNSGSLPPAPELAARIHEAISTASLLQQMVKGTPLNELEMEPTIQQLAESVQAAVKSLMRYIDSRTPYPDNETLDTMLKAYEKCSFVMLQHWQAVLEARNRFGDPSRPVSSEVSGGAGPSPVPQQGQQQQRPDLPLRQQNDGSQGSGSGLIRNAYSAAPNTSSQATGGTSDDPFADQNSQAPPVRDSYSLFSSRPNPAVNPQQLQTQPYAAPPPPPPSTRPPAAPLTFDPQPQAQGSRYNDSWQPTQSYVARQDAATDNITVHGGASPPTPATTTAGEGTRIVKEV
ncbi:putative gat domain-containing protein [Phaeomoniella chlamydospora]|uniref:Putative gat domain-containing protein n=1 Tax=Phaeomoniella chlamydospora TaxID=158046 RepID=A0A0G2GB56_PHACM|nr:putative gat domain-containing protein [Phaeomoniella chlamydospora]